MVELKWRNEKSTRSRGEVRKRRLRRNGREQRKKQARGEKIMRLFKCLEVYEAALR